MPCHTQKTIFSVLNSERGHSEISSCNIYMYDVNISKRLLNNSIRLAQYYSSKGTSVSDIKRLAIILYPELDRFDITSRFDGLVLFS
jgi:hypothetical protein